MQTQTSLVPERGVEVPCWIFEFGWDALVVGMFEAKGGGGWGGGNGLLSRLGYKEFIIMRLFGEG